MGSSAVLSAQSSAMSLACQPITQCVWFPCQVQLKQEESEEASAIQDLRSSGSRGLRRIVMGVKSW